MTKNRRLVFCILPVWMIFFLSGCYKPMNPDFFHGTCKYAIDERGRETITVKGNNMESLWGVSSIETKTFADRINLETTVRYRSGNSIHETIDVTNVLRVTLNGKTIWESEPYRRVFMTDDFDGFSSLCKDKVPLPEKFTMIPSPVMRRRALEQLGASEKEIEQINLLLELQDDIHPLWIGNRGLALKIINQTPLKDLTELERLELLYCAVHSGTTGTMEAILNSGIDVACGFRHFYEVKMHGVDPGINYGHGLVKEAIQARNLAAAELFIKRGAPYSDEEKKELEKMHAAPLEYLPAINTLARLEALFRAGVAADDPRMGLNGIRKPPLETMPEMLSFDWHCTTGTLIQLRYLLEHGAKQGLTELLEWSLRNNNKAVLAILANKSVQAGSPFIRFQLVSAETENRLAERTTKAPPTGMEWIQNHQTGEWILLEQESWDIPSVAEVKNYESKDMPSLVVSLYPEDAKRFYELTQKYIGRRLAVFVLGDYCCSPVIRAPIQGGRIQITGVANTNEVLEKFKINVKKNRPAWRETMRRDKNGSLFWTLPSDEKNVTAEKLNKTVEFILSQKPPKRVHGSLYGDMPYFEIPGTELAVFLLKPPREKSQPFHQFHQIEIVFKNKTRSEAQTVNLQWNDGGVVVLSALYAKAEIDCAYLRKYAEFLISHCIYPATSR